MFLTRSRNLSDGVEEFTQPRSSIPDQVNSLVQPRKQCVSLQKFTACRESSSMKYMLLIYSDEKKWTTEEWTACTIQSTEICHELATQGQFIGAAPLHPVDTAQTV